jgi:hypothetical protein
MLNYQRVTSKCVLMILQDSDDHGWLKKTRNHWRNHSNIGYMTTQKRYPLWKSRKEPNYYWIWISIGYDWVFWDHRNYGYPWIPARTQVVPLPKNHVPIGSSATFISRTSRSRRRAPVRMSPSWRKQRRSWETPVVNWGLKGKIIELNGGCSNKATLSRLIRKGFL